MMFNLVLIQLKIQIKLRSHITNHQEYRKVVIVYLYYQLYLCLPITSLSLECECLFFSQIHVADRKSCRLLNLHMCKDFGWETVNEEEGKVFQCLICLY